MPYNIPPATAIIFVGELCSSVARKGFQVVCKSPQPLFEKEGFINYGNGKNETKGFCTGKR